MDFEELWGTHCTYLQAGGAEQEINLKCLLQAKGEGQKHTGGKHREKRVGNPKYGIRKSPRNRGLRALVSLSEEIKELRMDIGRGHNRDMGKEKGNSQLWIGGRNGEMKRNPNN